MKKLVGSAVVAAIAASAGFIGMASGAGATATSSTDPTVLTGESGSFSFPLITQLISDASSAIAPETGGDIDFDVDRARDDFASLNDDFAVSEYPLSSADATAAVANGRNYAYVPFAAVPVDIGIDLLATNSGTASSYLPSSFLQDMEFTPAQLMFLFTTVGASDHNWNANSYLALTSASSAAQCAVDQLLPICSGLPVAVTGQSTNGLGINPILPKFPSATVTSLENLFSTSPSTSSSWVTWLSEQPNPEQSDELWPVDVGTGNDQGVLDALIPFSAQSNGFPATTVAAFDSDNGSVAPLPSDWIYPASNLNGFQVPTAELQNAAGDFVAGTPASAQAALSDASVNATTNLVTFPTNDANPASYPMVDMSYLIVPTSGLSSAKDTALGKLIQFILGAAGATDISAAGAAPITKSADPQLYAADESVASDLIALGSKPATVTTSATASNTSSTSTSTTTTTVVAAAATSPTTTTIASGTVTPASAPKGAVPMGFASATSDLVSATDGTVEAGMSDLRVDVDVPAGEFATPTQITLSSGPTTAIKLPTGESAVAAVSIAIDQGGTKFAGTFASPVPVTIESLKLAKGAKLFLYNPATKAYVASATGSTISHVVASVGSVTFDLTGDPQFVIAEPASAPAARAPASKTPKAAPTVTTTTAAPVVTSSGGSSGSGGGSAGSGGVLAFTGISTIPVLLGASVLVLGAEGLRRRQLRSVRAARNTSRGNRR